jgi:DNA-binding NtrC family response regulator
MGAAVESEKIRILVAEDDEQMVDLLQRVLGEEGYLVTAVRDGAQALSKLEEEPSFDLVLTDLRMPGLDGMELMRRAMARQLRQPVILMTAFGTIDSAVQAMREGAYHYLAKPVHIEDLLEIVGSAADVVRQQHGAESAIPLGDASFFPIVFRSASMAALLKMAHEVAASSASVLITGSSGTGKELLARAIHGLSPRSPRPFVAVDCNAIPETLLESELFGHRRGSFTGATSDKRGLVEEASEGTLFLDEIGNLSPVVQAKLLRFLQERRFRRVGDTEERVASVRLVSASNKDLREETEKGTFREDLFYRLSVIPLRIPDLKDRREDIAPLAYHFVRKFNVGYKIEGIRKDALELLLEFHWPGNVRQIENVIERAVILRKAGLIQPRDLPEEISTRTALPSAKSLEETERDYILQLLRECNGNQTQVSRILGINRRTLYRKLRKYGSEPGEEHG